MGIEDSHPEGRVDKGGNLKGACPYAKNVNKDMVYAIVDEECDVTYYLVDRMRL